MIVMMSKTEEHYSWIVNIAECNFSPNVNGLLLLRAK